MKKVTFNNSAHGRRLKGLIPVATACTVVGGFMAFEYYGGPIFDPQGDVRDFAADAPYAQPLREGACLFAVPTQTKDVVFNGSDQSALLEVLEEINIFSANRPEAKVTVGSYPSYIQRPCAIFAENAGGVFRTVEEARDSQAANTAQMVKRLEDLARTYPYRVSIHVDVAVPGKPPHNLIP